MHWLVYRGVLCFFFYHDEGESKKGDNGMREQMDMASRSNGEQGFMRFDVLATHS